MAEMFQMRERIDSRLTQLKSMVDVLSALVQEPPKLDQDDSPELLDSVGISEAIRQVLKDAGVGLMPNQVKAKLSDVGFDLTKYVNPSAVIHNTLKRLETQGEVVQVRDSSGVMAYAIRPSFAEQLGATIISAPTNDSLAAMDADGRLTQSRKSYTRENFIAAHKRRFKTL